jgi:hypothetical protein
MDTEERTDEWTTIATRRDTQTRLSSLKKVKAPGKLDNYDDVIRRGFDMPPIEEDKP